MPLTATPKGLQPGPRHYPPKRLQSAKIPRHSVIVKVALHHQPQPLPGYSNPLMLALTQFLPHSLPFVPQPLFDRLPSHREPVALLSPSAYVRKTKKIESLGFPLSTFAPVAFRKPPKLDQSRFLRGVVPARISASAPIYVLLDGRARYAHRWIRS